MGMSSSCMRAQRMRAQLFFQDVSLSCLSLAPFAPFHSTCSAARRSQSGSLAALVALLAVVYSQYCPGPNPTISGKKNMKKIIEWERKLHVANDELEHVRSERGCRDRRHERRGTEKKEKRTEGRPHKRLVEPLLMKRKDDDVRRKLEIHKAKCILLNERLELCKREVEQCPV